MRIMAGRSYVHDAVLDYRLGAMSTPKRVCPGQESGTAGATGRGARMAIIVPLTQATQIRKGNRPSTPAKPLAL